MQLVGHLKTTCQYFIERISLGTQARSEEILQQWLDDPLALGEKHIAAQKIREAYQNYSTRLFLHSLKLNSLPVEIFPMLTHLKELILSSNEFTSLSFPPLSLPALKVLYLDRNKLASLIISENSLTSLEELFLFNNKFTSFSIGEEILTTLKVLSLSHNNLDFISLPRNLTMLQRIHLDYNRLRSIYIPESYTSLHSIDLSYNLLPSFFVPERLVRLGQLRLSGNKLTSLYIPASSIPSLWQLHLENNPDLTSLPFNLLRARTLLDIKTEGSAIPRRSVETILEEIYNLRIAILARRMVLISRG